MNDTKSWYTSKTVIGGIVAIIMAALQAFGVVGAEGQEETLAQFITQIATAIAGILVIVGRLTATKKVTK